MDEMDFSTLFADAFRADTDRPLKDASGHIRRDYLLGLGVFVVSTLIWFLMNVGFQPRFLLETYRATPWMWFSVSTNLLFGVCLLVARKTRPYALVPFMFALFPAAFLIDSTVMPYIRDMIKPTAAAKGADWKFVADLVFISLELVFALLILSVARVGNPFSLKKSPHLGPRPMVPYVVGLEVAFLVVVWGLQMDVLYKFRFPIDRYFSLFGIQVVFSILLGLKEELIFRWLIVRIGERMLGSRWTAVLINATLWSSYHYFFGEAVGTGLWASFWVFVVSVWWALLSYRRNSIWAAFAAHFVIEMFGFYVMYLPLISG
ncbi:MAG: CPBP family intramembrane glutamic endopeptidase [Treponemataceae bacterium]